jgi:glycerol-3-phosphate dehydrogenase (NAD+)
MAPTTKKTTVKTAIAKTTKKPSASPKAKAVTQKKAPAAKKSSLASYDGKLQVCIVGSGNWGSTAAKIIGENILNGPAGDRFEREVRMWVLEEQIPQDDGSTKKLSEIINEQHENVKYLKGIKLPHNVKAVPDLKEAATGAKIFIWVLPHQFIARTAKTVKEVLDPKSISISMVKGGIDVDPKGVKLCSETIAEILGTEVGVIMGANVADEVARGDFCEATVAMKTPDNAEFFRLLFDAPRFSIQKSSDVEGVELCGGLKNVVALGAGFTDGLGMGSNTKAAVMRVGLLEMEVFIRNFYPSVQSSTFMESCGVADLITTCFSGRNRKCAAAFAEAQGQRPWAEIEAEMLGGQKLQGTLTLQEIWPLIQLYKLEAKLPLMCAIKRIAFDGDAPQNLFAALGRPEAPPAQARGA